MPSSKSQTGRSRPFLWILRLFVLMGLCSSWFSLSSTVYGVFWLRHAMHAQLPKLDGDIHLSGLRSAVTVRRDAHAIPHIDATNMDDLLVAQGYLTAQDRLWQMDMTRRFAAGELAEVFGNSIFGSQPLEHDRLQRVLQFRRTAERITASLPANERRYFRRLCARRQLVYVRY